MDDVDTMARTIWAEARGEPRDGQVAVAWAIRHRARDMRNRWPKSISAVCKQPKQFSCWNADDPNRAKMLAINLDRESFVVSFGIACLVLANDLSDASKGSNHYHTIAQPDGVREWPPEWARSMEERVRIGRHVFLRI